MRNHNLEEFNQFWTSNFKNDVPPLPKKPNDLSITEQEIMRSESPKLYQNLFKTSVDSGQLPADLEMRIRNSNLWVEDADRLRKFGYEFEAQKIETAKAQFENEQLEKKIAESQARQEEQRKINEQRRNMPLIQKLALESQGQTMDQVIRNRMKYHGRID